MLVTKHIQVSTRLVCCTMLTEYVGHKAHTDFYTLTEYVCDKTHTGFYTHCLSYNTVSVCWLQSTYTGFYTPCFSYNTVRVCWLHIQVSTRSVCRTMLTEYVGDKTHTSFYTPCLSYNTDRVC